MACRSYAMWDILLPTEKVAKSLAGNILTVNLRSIRMVTTSLLDLWASWPSVKGVPSKEARESTQTSNSQGKGGHGHEPKGGSQPRKVDRGCKAVGKDYNNSPPTRGTKGGQETNLKTRAEKTAAIYKQAGGTTTNSRSGNGNDASTSVLIFKKKREGRRKDKKKRKRNKLVEVGQRRP